MKIIDAVAKYVPSPHKVDLSNPEINIVVQIVKVHIIAYKCALLFFEFLCHTVTQVLSALDWSEFSLSSSLFVGMQSSVVKCALEP